MMYLFRDSTETFAGNAFTLKPTRGTLPANQQTGGPQLFADCVRNFLQRAVVHAPSRKHLLLTISYAKLVM
jgi:hypothetical protein